MRKKAVLFIYALFISISTYAQAPLVIANTNQKTSFNFQRTIKLEQNSKEEVVVINIEKQTKRFDFKIDTSVSSGKLTIEIFDSNGKKQGTFSVGTQLNLQNAERAEGNINKSLVDPQAGDWKIKIIPIKANGMIQINTATFL